MKVYVLVSILLFYFLGSINAAKIFQPQQPNLFIVDNFEDQDLSFNPKWWGFSFLEFSIEKNNTNEASYIGEYSLQLTGKDNHWYVGGCGTYFGIDIKNYNAIKLIVRGFGLHSGALIIELFDDDNNNWEVETHPEISSSTMFDDKFIYTLKVDWNGWRVVIIPFDKFIDDNPNIGDDTWNPNQLRDSGGLLQMQMVLLATKKDKAPRIYIDEIKIFKEVQQKKQLNKSKNFDMNFLSINF